LELKRRQLLTITFARYYNLLIEYLLLMATALLMQPGERGTFVMYSSAFYFFSLLGSLSYEQYGAAEKYKYADGFNEKNFFTVLVLLSFVIGGCASIFAFIWLGGGAFVSVLTGLNVVAITMGKQSIVHFQISGDTSKYFSRFVLYKSLYFAAIAYPASQSSSIEIILLFALFSNILFLPLIGFFDSKRFVSIISTKIFFRDFFRVKYLYFTAIVTALYSFVDLYIVYTNLDAHILSEYNLAVQLNMAIAVVGQAYNIHIYSDKSSQTLSAIIFSMKKINLFIIGLSLLIISAVHHELFSILVNFVFGEEYSGLPLIIRSTIWTLPASLVAMFYAPLWISSGKYLALSIVSVIGLVLFTTCAMVLIDLGIQGVIYAQYVIAVYGLIMNCVIYLHAKKLNRI
jgi:O-antigen/teichoic acid export membrane protein